MPPELRVITSEDWSDFRAVRLSALADSPDAFGATLEQAAAHAEAVWRERADAGPVVLAYDAGRVTGMGGLSLPQGSPDAFVWGMWVEPASRGRGIGARVLRELLRWSQGEHRVVYLHVTDGNAGARRLYEAHGFVATGEWSPLRDGSELRMETMRLAPPEELVETSAAGG